MFYENWFDRGIQYISDLLNPPLPGSKLFDELVLDFEVSQHEKRKFIFLKKWIPSLWLEDSNSSNVDLFDTLIESLLDATKIPKFAYSFLMTFVFQKILWNFRENLNVDVANDDEYVDDIDKDDRPYLYPKFQVIYMLHMKLQPSFLGLTL